MWPISHIVMFVGMLFIHIAVMPWIMIARLRDYRFSLNQLYMGIAMATLMVMLEALMHPMPMSGWIVTIAVFLLAVAATKGQWFISDSQFLRDMIPHHSMALLTSGVAKHKASDPRVRELATTIEKTQTEEIKTMQAYLVQL